jgi:VTC domain-containing protein
MAHEKLRIEFYEVPLLEVGSIQKEVVRNLPRYELRKGVTSSFITTIEFDMEQRNFFRDGKESCDENAEVCVKEYYYQRNPSPAGDLGYSSTGPWLTTDICYLEIKQHILGSKLKRRFEVPKRLLGRLLGGEDIWEDLLTFRPGIGLGGIQDIYQEFLRCVQHCRLNPRSIINHRRCVYQRDEYELRITFDDEIAAFASAQELFDSVSTLTRDVLGLPQEVSSNAFMNIYCSREHPSWLGKLLEIHQPKRKSSAWDE